MKLPANNNQHFPGVSRGIKYTQGYSHPLYLGVVSLVIVFGISIYSPSDASILRNPLNNTTNSQKLSLLAPNYTIEIPQATGGPNDIAIDNQLALLSPQLGVGDSVIGVKRNIEAGPLGVIEYTVQKGDTLSEISELFDVSVNTIKWENDIGNTIKLGQELRILPITGVHHNIAKGDTLAKIAKEYDAELEDISIFNDIDDTKLVIGEKLLIPNGIKRSPVAKPIFKSSNKVNLGTPGDSSGYYMRPTTAPVTSSFGPRKGTYHYGIDYGAPTGTPIYATADGRVIKTTCGSGYGNCLVIQHSNGTQSLYAHASKLYASNGQRVVQGEKIAAIGSTGRSTGPHLHFEIIESNGRKRNVNFLR
jgi:murein DD-endopeptidase MepM/ murein hydrolase activator NlpD